MRVFLAALIFCVCASAAHAEPASWYSQGRVTASGARFNPNGFTAASRSLPFGTRVRVCLSGCVVVTVNDFGPAAWTGRAIDLARGAAAAIGLIRPGVANVSLQIEEWGHGPMPGAHLRARPGAHRHRNTFRLRFARRHKSARRHADADRK